MRLPLAVRPRRFFLWLHSRVLPRKSLAENYYRYRSCGSALIPLLKQSFVHPAGHLAAAHFPLPLGGLYRIKPGALLRFHIADELRNRLRVASDENLMLFLESLLRFWPALA